MAFRRKWRVAHRLLDDGHVRRGDKPMTPFKHILVPTDFGESAERALDLAIVLASRFESKVTLLHASWIPPLAYAGYTGLAWPVDEMMATAQKELDAVVAKAKVRYPRVEGFITMSDPTAAILEVAKSNGADLIVMGTHGRRGIARALVGSVAERIVRLSLVPVLTVSGKAECGAEEKSVAHTAATTRA
jgi:nucleotide-binding universal stress UspA family protein